MADYITAGEVFTGSAPDKSVTPTRLNHHVTGLRILPAFMDSATHAAPAALTDVVLCANAAFSAFNMPTLTQLFAAQVADAAAVIASLRTIGTGALQAAPGNFLTLQNAFTGTRQSFRHIGSAGGASISPTGGAGSAGLGTTGTSALGSGSGDLAGFITLQPSGGTYGTSALAATVSFVTAFSAAPWVFLVPYNQTAIAAMQTGKALNVVASAGSFDIMTGTTALVGGTTLQFQYLCIL